MNWLNYHHLYYFWVIATEGGIARAAERLRLGQPALSMQLKQLEEQLGVELFERRHKKLILTEAGKMALDYANEIFRLGPEMVEALHDRLVSSRVHVQLGALDSVPKRFIYRLVRAAYDVAPCSVSVFEGKDDELLRELLAHRIDLILTHQAPAVTAERRLFTRPLAKLPVIVCGAAKFRHLKKGFPKSMDQQPFVMPTIPSRMRNDVEHFFHTRGVWPDLVAETQDTSLQKILGAEGIGLIPVAEPAVRSHLKSGELVKIGALDGVFEEFFLVSASRRIENPVSRELLKSFSL